MIRNARKEGWASDNRITNSFPNSIRIFIFICPFSQVLLGTRDNYRMHAADSRKWLEKVRKVFVRKCQRQITEWLVNGDLCIHFTDAEYTWSDASKVCEQPRWNGQTSLNLWTEFPAFPRPLHWVNYPGYSFDSYPKQRSDIGPHWGVPGKKSMEHIRK